MQSIGTFILSLDFELFWGVQDVTTMAAYGPNVLGVRTAIPGMLDLLTKYGVHASWATVGMLAAHDRAELEAALPAVRPEYAEGAFSNYRYLAGGAVGSDEQTDPYHFGASLIERIRATPGQEIACHTFSHYYCLEEGASIASFEADLRAWQGIFAGRATLDSVVFPRNQVTHDHLRVCHDLGVKACRGTQDHPIYAAVSTARQYQPFARMLRLLDAYVNLTGHHTYTLAQAHQSVPVDVRASRFLRPYSSTLSFLESLKVRRVTTGMTYAAERGEVFHLWWHPHNFGVNIEQNLAMLERILTRFAALRDAGRMRSMTMCEATTLV